MSSTPPPPAGVPPLPAMSAAPVPTQAPAPGEVLDGRYVLQDPIGEGGVGLIFRALQFKVQRPVAVKFLQRDVVGEHQLKPRFEREAMALAALAHPNIVRLQDYGVSRGHPFLVMEYVEGRTLRGLLNDEGGSLAPARAIDLARQLLFALAYAHERGIVHRDLKPANLIVQQLPSQPEHLKVLDFGFAKFLPGSELDLGAQLTRSGHTFGSPAYMSPEHATGSPVDGRADVYSVGILLFEMLTGTRPFEGDIQQLLRHHLVTPVPRLADRASEFAGRHELQDVLDRALAKSRNDRFAGAAEFVEALDQCTLESQSMPLVRAYPIGAWESRGQAAGAVLDRWQELLTPWVARSALALRQRLLPPVAAGVQRLIGRRPRSHTPSRLIADAERTSELLISSLPERGGSSERAEDASADSRTRSRTRKSR